jgi:predicted murein hydrolase (TIGR00659 family)
MADFLSWPVFGITITLGAYLFACWLSRKANTALLNPLLIAAFIIMAFLLLTGIDYETYANGGRYIELLLLPATVCLAIPIYHKRAILKKYWLAILIGCAAGAGVCMLCIKVMSGWFGLTDDVVNSILSKSTTTPFALAVSESLGGIRAITIVGLTITGIAGNMLAPSLIRLSHVNNPVAAGLGIGTASHVVGTSRALVIGETEGAVSGIAITITGIFTVVFSLFL